MTFSTVLMALVPAIALLVVIVSTPTASYNGNNQALINLATAVSVADQARVPAHTGAQLNGLDASRIAGRRGPASISGFSVDATVYVSAYSASGSVQSTTGTIAAGSSLLALAAAKDFSDGEGVLIFGAGPPTLYPVAPPAPSVSIVGTAGTTSYCYAAMLLDYWGGHSAASRATCVATGPATPTTPTHYPKIAVFGLACSYCAVALYRSINGNAYSPMAVLPFGNGTIDDCNLPAITDAFIPKTPVTKPGNQAWVTTVISGGGTRALKLAGTAPASVSNATVWHDDTQAIQNAINAGTNRLIVFPRGTYNLNQPSYWNGSGAWLYTNPTTEPPANRMSGILHLGSNIALKGSGRKVTTLSSSMFGSIYHAILAAVNASATRPAGPVCNDNSFASYAINNASRGSSSIVLTTASNATNFSMGDFVCDGGGVDDPQVSNSSSNPTAELNQVVAIDGSTGTLYLRYPLSKAIPYGTPGTAPFVRNVNAGVFHDISLSDMKLDTAGGGQALALGDVVHLDVSRVDMPGTEWSGTIDLNESRAVWFDAIYLHSTASEEFDQVRDVVFTNSTFYLQSGFFQLAFTEGAANISLIGNTFTANDAFCGLGGRCELGGPGVMTFFPGGPNFKIISNKIDSQWVSGGGGIGIIAPDTGIPVLAGIYIHGNSFHMTSAGPLQGVELDAPAVEQVVNDNDLFLAPGGANSRAIGVLTGIVSNNNINMATAGAPLGVIHMNITATQTAPLVIENNHIRAAPGSVCMYLSGSGSETAVIRGNTCGNSGTGFSK